MFLSCGSGEDAPVLVHQPRPEEWFSNSTGLVLNCRAYSTSPVTIDWVDSSLSPLSLIPGVRSIISNSSLWFPPVSQLRDDVHGDKVRCRATSQLGTVLGRLVSLHPGTAQSLIPDTLSLIPISNLYY